MSTHCPYCKSNLDPVPKRKKKCPSCGEPIYVRQGKLRTEFDALMVDWLNYLAPLNISKKHFTDARKDLAQQFGHAPGFYDVVWRILNNVVATSRSSDSIAVAYSEMARVASSEGKDPRQFQALAHTTKLRAMKSKGEKSVAIMSYGGEGYSDPSTCEACRALHRARLSIDDALETLPIPNNCTSDTGCRCEYVSVRDLMAVDLTKREVERIALETEPTAASDPGRETEQQLPPEQSGKSFVSRVIDAIRGR